MDEDKKKLNIYLDNCCYNRPYDDQRQLSVEFETKAKLFIQNLIEEGRVSLTISYMSEFEAGDSPYEDRRIPIFRFFENAEHVVIETPGVLKIAKELERSGLKAHDAIHVSCAINAYCDYFFTVDKRLLKLNDSRIKMMNPTEFIGIWENEENEE
jgi:predicted nucleic acid-binding protein